MRTTRRRWFRVALTTTVVVLAVPSLTAASSVTEPASSTPTPVAGGSATFLSNGQPVRLDPQLNRMAFSFIDGPMMSAIYGQLAGVDPTTGAVELYFLESLTPSDDFVTWTLKLHPDLLFSDGTPFDAAAIEFNMTRAADPDLGSPFKAVAEGLTFNVVDDVTLEVTLSSPNSTFDTTIVSAFAAVGSPTAIQAATDAGEEYGLNPVGAGPFMIESWEPGTRAVMVRNPNYEHYAPGQPYLDEVVFEILPDMGQQRAAIASGDAQITYAMGLGPAEELAENANALIIPQGGASSLNMNQTRPPFDDERARRAIALALDRVRTSNAFTPDTPPAESLFAATSPFYDPQYTFPDNDPEEAQRLFDELAAEGKPVDFSYLTTDAPQHQALANQIVTELAAFDNVSVTIETRPSAEWSPLARSGEYQMIPYAWVFSNPTPTLIDFLSSDGPLNTFGWHNEVVDEAIAEVISTTDIDVQREAWGRVQAEFIEDVPVVPLAQTVVALGWADGLVVTKALGYGGYPLWGEVGYLVASD